MGRCFEFLPAVNPRRAGTPLFLTLYMQANQTYPIPAAQRSGSNLWRAFAFLFLALALLAPARAQPAGGSVTGAVSDSQSGKFLEGADVTIEGTAIHATTTRDGRFTLRDVPPGARNLVVSYPGHEVKTTPITVDASRPTSADVRLAGDIVQLGAFKVTTAREGMAQAVALQRVSIQQKLVAAADQFGEVSEGNVGEYLKFMPGVSIDYNVNDARGVSLRGLSTAFTIVAVDGTPMAGGSSTDDTRRFEFEQIAMNNVETTELFKSVTPDIPATSTGGFVNFVTKSAFDHEEVQLFSYNASLSAPSTNMHIGQRGGVWGHQREYTVRPSLELNFARKLSPKVGFNVNYRLSEKYDDSPRTEFTWVTAATAPTVFTTPRLQQYNIRQEEKLTHREAFAAKVDWIISDRTKLMIGGQWNWYDLNFTQRGPNFVLGTAATVSGNDYTSGATGASIQNGVLYRNKYGTTLHFNSTLTQEFDGGGKLSITPYWSHADSQYRDTNKGFVSSVATMASGATTFSSFTLTNPTNLGTLPTITIRQGTNVVPTDFVRAIGNYTLSNTATGTSFQSRPWTALDDKNGFRADYSVALSQLPIPTTLQVGYALDKTERRINRPDYRTAIPATTGAALVALYDPNYGKDVALGFGNIQAVDPFKVYDAFKSLPATLNVFDQRRIEETNNAAYVRGDLKLSSSLLLIGGLRWEKREIAATGTTGAPARARTSTANLDFDSYYPSLSLRYTPVRSIVVRGGFSRTIGIPDYGELLPTFITSASSGTSDGTISVPSGTIKPYSTNNFDINVDYYLRNSGVVTFSAFRKDVKDYIISRPMTAAETAATLTSYGLTPADFGTTAGTIRENGSKSRLSGFEIGYAQNMTFLPKPFDGLNVQANYSVVDISASDSDPLRAIDTEYSQSRAVSPRTANFILGYRYGSFNTTITTNWVSESLFGGFVNTSFLSGAANANPALDTRLALYRDEKATTDVKVEYSFSKRFSAYFLVRNIFNSARKDYAQGYLPQYRATVLPWRYYEFGEPHLTLGVRGRF